MEAQIITIFCVIDDILKSSGFRDDVQVQLSTAEIMTISVAAGFYFGGNHERTREYFRENKYVKYILSKSQFNRRLHQIDESLWENVQHILGRTFVELNDANEYVVDSYPVAVCENIRIPRCKIYQNEEYRGKAASKSKYFFGVRVHVVSTMKGGPVEYRFAPGSHHDLRAFKCFDFDLPDGATIYGDRAYTDYDYEDALEEAGKKPMIARKGNSKRHRPGYIEYLTSHYRKRIETIFSQITNLFPKSIHAVTAKGFELKILSFILAYSFSQLQVTT